MKYVWRTSLKQPQIKEISTIRQWKIAGAQKATSYLADASELGMGSLQPPFQRISRDLPSGTQRLQRVYPTRVLHLRFKSRMPKDLLPRPLMRDCLTHRQLESHDKYYATMSAVESKSQVLRLLFLQ
jgi:hypothetical protein